MNRRTFLRALAAAPAAAVAAVRGGIYPEFNPARHVVGNDLRWDDSGGAVLTKDFHAVDSGYVAYLVSTHRLHVHRPTRMVRLDGISG